MQTPHMTSTTSPFTFFEDRFTPDMLPPELLSYIFMFAVSGNRRIRHEVPCEVQLSHVSRKWRGVALTTPLLWTTVVIYSPKFKNRVLSYLRRSGSRLPLSVFIDIYEWDKTFFVKPSATNSFTQQVRDQLLDHFPRIRKLSIFCFQEHTACLLQSCFANTSAPMLESLCVDFDSVSSSSLVVDTLFSGGSPKLTFINTAFINVLTPSTSLQNVTTLFLHLHQSNVFTYTEFVVILTTSTSLLNLSVTGSSSNLINTWPVHFNGPDPNFVLPKLKHFRLFESGAGFAVRFLLSASAPNLESVWLDCSFNSLHTAFTAPQMNNPLGASAKFNKVQYLTLREYDLVYSAELARMFPDITHLHLVHAKLMHANRLTGALSMNWLKLYSLILTQARESNWDKFTIELASLLPERTSDGYPIQNLIMDRDFRKKLEERIPDIADMVTVVDLNVKTYQEPWWSEQIADPLPDGLSYVQSFY